MTHAAAGSLDSPIPAGARPLDGQSSGTGTGWVRDPISLPCFMALAGLQIQVILCAGWLLYPVIQGVACCHAIQPGRTWTALGLLYYSSVLIGVLRRGLTPLTWSAVAAASGIHAILTLFMIASSAFCWTCAVLSAVSWVLLLGLSFPVSSRRFGYSLLAGLGVGAVMITFVQAR